MKGRLVTVPGVGQLHVKLVDSSRFWNQELATRSVFVEIWETEVGDRLRLGPAACQKSLTVWAFGEFWKLYLARASSCVQPSRLALILYFHCFVWRPPRSPPPIWRARHDIVGRTGDPSARHIAEHGLDPWPFGLLRPQVANYFGIWRPNDRLYTSGR